MAIQLFLDVIISIGIILALTKKYTKSGLLLLGLSFLAKAVVTLWVDRNIVLGIFEAFASFSALYGYSKAVRHNYAPTKKAKLMVAGVLVLLGVWSATLGTFAPFLIAGVMGMFIVLTEGTVPLKKLAKELYLMTMTGTNRKLTFALTLNILLPGSGYIYLKAKNRLWVAIPLLLLAIYNIGYICFVFFTNSHYPYDRNLSPFTSTGTVHINVYSWFTFLIISIDTWDVARRIHQHEAAKQN